MIKIQVIQDDDVYQAIRGLPKAARELFPAIFKKQGMPVVNKAIRDFIALDPGPVKYKIQWQTERQRRAFFATNGFGNGIPYKRKTGRLSILNRWHFSMDRRQSIDVASIYNDAPEAGYVYPDIFMNGSYHQQRFHRNTGWGRDIEAGVIKVSEVVRDEVISAYVVAADQAIKKAGLG